MTAVAPIEGTVAITIGAGSPVQVESFSVPVAIEDKGEGRMVLHAATPDSIITAAAEALKRAAEGLLATIPTAIVEAAE